MGLGGDLFAVMHQHTQNTPPVVTDAEIEWLSIKQAVRLFSIGRSTLYTLLNEGKVKGRVVRGRGNIKGKRLLSAESLRLFIENCPAN